MAMLFSIKSSFVKTQLRAQEKQKKYVKEDTYPVVEQFIPSFENHSTHA